MSHQEIWVSYHHSQQHTPPNSLLPCNDLFFFFLLDGAWAGCESVLAGTLAPTVVGFAFDVRIGAVERKMT